MKLYVGGAYQGQEELARRENPDAVLLTEFHESVREAIARGENARDFALRVCREQPQAIVVADEVGSGVVPMRAEDRAYREAVGRALCTIAQEAEQVTRVVCGIGTRIK